MTDAQRRHRVGRANRGTRTADLAEHATGYSANAESQHTRTASRGPTINGIRTNSNRPPEWRGTRTLDQLLDEHVWKLCHMRAELRIEDDPARRAKLESNIAIKTQFIAKLRGEQ